MSLDDAQEDTSMMGAGLAKAAYAAANELDVREHAPVRAFVFMALTALDTDDRPAFYGGREALASAISAPRTTGGFKAVKNATRALVERGLVAVASKGAPGRPTKYMLLDGNGSPLKSDTARSPSPYSNSGDGERAVSNSEQGTVSDPTGPGERPQQGPLTGPPKEEDEKEEETRASAPTGTCQRHSNWNHSEPCRACAADRRSETASRDRRSLTMSERRTDCGRGNHRRLPDGTCMLCENRDHDD